MVNKIAEGVVQGILIAAIGFSAATVWTAFNKSTKDLTIAKSQLDKQTQLNKDLKQLIDGQQDTIGKLLKLNDRNESSISTLSDSIRLLSDKVVELSKKANVKVDDKVKKELSSIKDISRESFILKESLKSNQQQQRMILDQYETQRAVQQQIQQQW